MIFTEFLENSINKNFWIKYKIICFTGNDYPFLFFNNFFKKCENKKRLPAEYKSLPLNSTDSIQLMGNLQQSFLGQNNFYWLSECDIKKNTSNLNFLLNYKGPHFISFYLNEEKITNKIKTQLKKILTIKIDSPGGLPGASQAIFNELKLFKKEKPVVTFIENVCASGGYYIACASSHIVSTPSALVGSIGVVLNLGNIKHLLEDWKIKFHYIQSGKYKTAGSPLKDATPDELAYLQKLSDGNYDQFLKDVAESRKIKRDQYKTWADGKVFLGTDAKKLNLVDEIGSFYNATQAIKKLAKIDDEIKFIKPKRPSGLARLFMGEDENDSSGPEFSSKTASFLHDVYTKFFEKKSAINIS